MIYLLHPADDVLPVEEFGLEDGQDMHLLVVNGLLLKSRAELLKVPAGHVTHVVPHVDPVFIPPVPEAHSGLSFSQAVLFELGT